MGKHDKPPEQQKGQHRFPDARHDPDVNPLAREAANARDPQVRTCKKLIEGLKKL